MGEPCRYAARAESIALGGDIRSSPFGLPRIRTEGEGGFLRLEGSS